MAEKHYDEAGLELYRTDGRIDAKFGIYDPPFSPPRNDCEKACNAAYEEGHGRGGKIIESEVKK